MSSAACPICERGEPLGILAERPTTWITTEPVDGVPGYLCVVAKRHVVEPFELPPDDRAAFWEEAMDAAERLARAYRPSRLHYEIHGNTIPHLHMHLLPRYGGAPPPHDVEALREALA